MLKGLLAGLMLLLPLSMAQASPDELAAQKALVSLLSKGGYNLYIRHAATVTDLMDQRPVEFSSCDGQRNLSTQGRVDARRIGQAFTRLAIPVGQVRTSPYCRCKDTARLAFGRFEIDPQLLFSFGLDKVRRDQASAYLAGELAKPPQPGSNTVLVSHSANLDGATGIWPESEGGLYVFRPRPGGGAEYLGVILPADWQTL